MSLQHQPPCQTQDPPQAQQKVLARAMQASAWATVPWTHLMMLLDHVVAYLQVPLAGPCVTEAASSQVDVMKTCHFVDLWIKWDMSQGY